MSGCSEPIRTRNWAAASQASGGASRGVRARVEGQKEMGSEGAAIFRP